MMRKYAITPFIIELRDNIRLEMIRMPKLDIHYNKSLKLSNVLVRRLINKQEVVEFNQIVQNMGNYIKLKGAMPVGPVIQYTSPIIDQNGELDIVMEIMVQSNNFLQNVESPYYMKPIIRVKDCLYVRFIDNESKLNIAYEKIGVTAYEEDVELKGNSYTIFVGQQDDIITADIFMERAD